MRWLAFVWLLTLSGCAEHFAPHVFADPYGFWSGIWHGLVCPLAICVNFLSWLASLLGFDFLRSIEVIGRPNTGFGYYVGFFFGLCPYGSGGASR
jgi:hypothetical protein